MTKLKAICFTNDAGEVFDRAYYRLGREYGYIFKDVVVELSIREGRVRCGIHEPEKTVLAGCSPVIVERLITDLDDWLADGGDFYDLEQGEDRWVVFETENDELREAVESVIVETRDPAKAAQLIVVMKRFFLLLKQNEPELLAFLATLITFYLLAKVAVAGVPVLSWVVLSSFVFVFPVCLFYLIWYRLISK